MSVRASGCGGVGSRGRAVGVLVGFEGNIRISSFFFSFIFCLGFGLGRFRVFHFFYFLRR